VIYVVVILFLLGVIVRDFHIRELQAVGNEGYRQGYQAGAAYGRSTCPLPRT
jgi:hypothetical protein